MGKARRGSPQGRKTQWKMKLGSFQVLARPRGTLAGRYVAFSRRCLAPEYGGSATSIVRAEKGGRRPATRARQSRFITNARRKLSKAASCLRNFGDREFPLQKSRKMRSPTRKPSKCIKRIRSTAGTWKRF